MKDVSKQALENLITFIYCGEVKVYQENFEEFLNTAKALEIKGLVDECYEKAFDLPGSRTILSTPTQYQSTRTVYAPKSATPNLAHSHYDSMTTSEFQFEDDFGHGSGNSINENGNEMDLNTNYDYDTCIDGPSMLSTNLKIDGKNDRWNGKNEMLMKDDASKTKSVKRNNHGKQNEAHIKKENFIEYFG